MFTLDNTDGFTKADLAEMNEALKTLMVAATGDEQQDEKNFSDAISNLMRSGMTAEQIVAKLS